MAAHRMRALLRIAASVAVATLVTNAWSLHAVAREKSDRHALNAIMGEVFLAENGAAVQQKAARLDLPEQYNLLAEWVLPSASHPELRLAVQFADAHAASTAHPDAPSVRFPSGGRIESPMLNLIQAAQHIGRLSDVLSRIESAPSDSLDEQIKRLAALTLTHAAAGQPAEARQHLANLYRLISDQPEIPTTWESPLVLVLHVASEHEDVRGAARDLVHSLSQDQLNQIEPHNWRAFHRQLFALADKIEHGDRSQAFSQWNAGSLFTAESRGTGCPPNVWSRDESTVRKASGHSIDLLYFQSPLRGYFDVEYDASVLSWRDIYPYFADHWAGVDWTRKRTRRGQLVQDRADVLNLISPLTRFRHEIHYRISVRERKLTLYANGRALTSVNLLADHDPWVALRRSSKNSGRVWNVRIVGQPKIPDELRLTSNPELTGWISYFAPLGAPLRSQWATANGTLVSSPQSYLPSGSYAERLLYYHRPLLEDGDIEYAFFYQEGQVLVHPALDRTAFLLSPDGVQVHRITNGLFDRTGLPPDNQRVEPENQRGPATLPLRNDEWNRLRLAVQGNTVDLFLNDTQIYRQPIEPTNQRNFGLFHYADQTQAVVRDVVWRGDWPRELPALYEQELVDDSTKSLDESAAELPVVFHHNFAASPFPSTRFTVAEGKPTVVPTGDGLAMRMTGSGHYERSSVAAQLSISGDFDITASFDSLVTQPGPNGVSSMLLRLFFADPNNSETNYWLRHNRFVDREDQRLIYADFASYPESGTRRANFGFQPAENDAGTLRLARRGNQLYALFAEGDSQSCRLTASTEVPPNDIPLAGLHLGLLAHQNSSVSVRWEKLTVRAERLTGPATTTEVPK